MNGHGSRLAALILGLALVSPLMPEPAGSQQTRSILPDSVSVRRVDCTGRCWTWLTRFLLGPVATTDSAAFLLVNWGSDELTLSGITMVARGEMSERIWVQAYDSLDLGTLAPLHTDTIGLDLSAVFSKKPDRYVGEVRIRASEIEESLGTPVFLYIRSGPGSVILTLLIGFLFGRILIKINESGGTGGSKTTGESGGSKTLRFFGSQLAGFRWNVGNPGFRGGLAALLSGVAWEDGSNSNQFRGRVGVSWVLLALAVYHGLKLLYFNDLTFGDNGILDYAAVFAWAAGADSGQRFLTNFKWSPKRE